MSLSSGMPELVCPPDPEMSPPSMTVPPLRSVSLVSTLRVEIVGELVTPVSVLPASLTSCCTSRSIWSPEWMTGLIFRMTPVVRYCTVCSSPLALVPPMAVVCWALIVGTSSPTWMVADSPLRAIRRGLDRMVARLLDASALMAVRSAPTPLKRRMFSPAWLVTCPPLAAVTV